MHYDHDFKFETSIIIILTFFNKLSSFVYWCVHRYIYLHLVEYGKGKKNQQFENQHFKSTCTEFHLFFGAKTYRLEGSNFSYRLKSYLWKSTDVKSFWVMKYKGYREDDANARFQCSCRTMNIFFNNLFHVFYHNYTLVCVFTVWPSNQI